MPRRNLRILLFVALISLLCQNRFNYYGATFVRALEEIHDHYLEPVDRRVLLHAALKGMASRLDPYSEYIPPADFTDLQENLEQQFGGVGIQIGLDPETNQLTVISPMVGTPAYRAGVLAGDKVLEIDGKSTEGFAIADAAKLLRGVPDTPVRMRVLHLGDREPVELTMRRAIIEIETVLGDRHRPDGTWDYWLPGQSKIAYIRISQFSEKTVGELKAALEQLQADGMRGLVLDLRNNPGGLLDQAVDVCNLFVRDGLIVSTRGRNGVQYDTYFADGKAPYADLPLVVLLNHYSASASEIVAACLQDHDRAVIVGERSWGKGSVQNLIPLEGGRSVLKLTTYSYWRPSGKNIHRLNDAPETEVWGVSANPGYEVKLNQDELEALFRYRRDRDIVHPSGGNESAGERDLYEADSQLKRAVEALSQPAAA